MFPTRSLHAANILCSYAYRLGCVIFCQPGNIYIVKRHIKYLPISLHWITETVQLAQNKSRTRAFAAFTCMQRLHAKVKSYLWKPRAIGYIHSYCIYPIVPLGGGPEARFIYLSKKQKISSCLKTVRLSVTLCCHYDATTYP